MVKRLVFAVLMASAAFSAPFCTVSATGKNCWYFRVDDCQRAAAGIGGACIYQDEEPVHPISPPPDPEFRGFRVAPDAQKSAVESLQPWLTAWQGVEQQRQRSELHDAEMQKIQAETEFVKQQSKYYRSRA